MNIKPSASIRNNYNEISKALCKSHRRASLFNKKAAREIWW